MLQRAEDYYQRKQGRTPIGTAARGATEMAEDARVLTLRRKEQDREADRPPRRRRRTSQSRSRCRSRPATRAAGPGASHAKTRVAGPTLSRLRLRLWRSSSKPRPRPMQPAPPPHRPRCKRQEAQRETEEAERQKQEAVQQKEAMRARLLAQLNQVLQTRDTARGLIVSMPDVLFDFGKYTLKSGGSRTAGQDFRNRARLSRSQTSGRRPHRQHWQRRVQPDPFRETRRDGARLPGLLRSFARPRRRSRPRQSRSGRRQRRPPTAAS